MNEIIKGLMEKLQNRSAQQMQPASLEDLKCAKEAQFPDELLDFYREYEPVDYVELKQRIWSIQNALEENMDAVPGCALFPHGFVVFASTLCGDAYCIDTNVENSEGKHPIVLFSHEMIEEETSLIEIQSLRVEVAKSLDDFLLKFFDETLIEEPFYG